MQLLSFGCSYQNANGTHFPGTFFSMERLKWLPERGSRRCPNSLASRLLFQVGEVLCSLGPVLSPSGRLCADLVL